MIDFVKKAFRGGVAVILWINIILSTIIGGVAGYLLGQAISYRNAGGYAFLGVLIGIALGLIIDIIGGGFITTILSIEKNTEEQTALLKKSLGIADNLGISETSKALGMADNPGISNTDKPLDTTLANNKINIRRLENVIGSVLLVDVSIDNTMKFQLANGEEKILDIENGKHTIVVSCDNEFDTQDFEMDTEGKKFNVFIKPPVKIETV